MGKLRDQLTAAQTQREQFESRQSGFRVERTRTSASSSGSSASSSVTDRERSLTLLMVGLAAFYLIVRFGFTQKLDAISEYASYALEISLVALTGFVLRPRLSWRALLQPLTLMVALGAFVAGAAILKFARISGIAVPMDVHNRETVFFLIGVAPVLEEAIFRFLLWKPVERVWDARAAWIATSLAFSYSHLHAIWFLPAEYSKFLMYQTAYTLPLGLACGWLLRRQGSLMSAMLLHFAFNLGFFLAHGV